MKKPKFKLGDRVKIVNYGCKLTISKQDYKDFELKYPILKDKGNFLIVDDRPERLGKITTIEKVDADNFGNQYSTTTMGSWYDESQLKKLNLFERFLNRE